MKIRLMGDAGRRSALLIHGAGGGGWEWRAWARVLRTRGFDVHAPDLVPITAGLAATGFADYRDQVLGYGRELPGPLLLAGASLGGLLALASAAELHPAALVLVNPVPPAGIPGWPPARRDWPGVVSWGDSGDFESTLRSMPDADHATRILAYRRWRNESGRVMAAVHDGIEVKPAGVPALVIASATDTDVPPAVSRALADRLHADFHQVPGSSHLGPILGDSATRCAVLVTDWFSTLVPDRP